ncbi:gas vesicle protein GvpJ [Paenibacillus montanisoli]|uniref:Gas vesicle protein n=1 Tax=Paenibacillus montanisoli TaxID=2081970 RepID=A0A328TXI0_9BACL|nr:gas vesicle protein GvpJ [Paenibacillus montanisoli]RAP75187.1 gas vesicle protein [Paenibacillus montanisoli]
MKDWYANKEITLLDILDGLLDKGIVVQGELILTVANIDLVYIDLRLLVTAVESIARHTELRI